MRPGSLQRSELVDNIILRAKRFGWDLKPNLLKGVKVPQLRRFLGWHGDAHLKHFLAELYQQGKIHRTSPPKPKPQRTKIHRWWMDL